MGDVDQDAQFVHGSDERVALVGEPRVRGLAATGPQQVLPLVGELQDAHAQVVEGTEQVEVHTDHLGVLGAEDDGLPAFGLGPFDVGDAQCE